MLQHIYMWTFECEWMICFNTKIVNSWQKATVIVNLSQWNREIISVHNTELLSVNCWYYDFLSFFCCYSFTHSLHFKYIYVLFTYLALRISSKLNLFESLNEITNSGVLLQSLMVVWIILLDVMSSMQQLISSVSSSLTAAKLSSWTKSSWISIIFSSVFSFLGSTSYSASFSILIWNVLFAWCMLIIIVSSWFKH